MRSIALGGNGRRLAGLLSMAACGATPPPTRLRETFGTVMATLALDPEWLMSMQATTLALRLQDSEQPVMGATVAMTLTMLGCSMTPISPVLQPDGDGLYQAQMVLTMAEIWRADANVTLPDGQLTLFTFFFATR